MEYQDYYSIMGVSRDATQDEIKRAYRKLARKYHPDVSQEPESDQRFKELGEAYEVLKDPEKRAAYDQLGANWKAGQDFRPPPDWDAGFEFRGGPAGAAGGAGPEAFSDFFEELFGRGFRQAGTAGGAGPGAGFRTGGQDHHAKILIEIEDSFDGGSRAIKLRMPEVTPDGHVMNRERTLNVKIPRGIRPGQQIRLARQGAPGLGGGPAGDLYLEIEFREHPLYRVEGADLHLTLPVAPWEAALGGKVPVPTPAGKVELSLPAGSDSGRRLRLKGRGLPGKSPGDLYVELEIRLPPADTEQARSLYERMREELPFDPRAQLKRGTVS